MQGIEYPFFYYDNNLPNFYTHISSFNFKYIANIKVLILNYNNKGKNIKLNCKNVVILIYLHNFFSTKNIPTIKNIYIGFCICTQLKQQSNSYVP